MSSSVRPLPVFSLPALVLLVLHTVAMAAEPEIIMTSEGDNAAVATTGSHSSSEGRLLVKFDPTLSANEIDSINRQLGVTVVNRMMGGTLLQVEVPYVGTLDQIIDAYAATEGVVYAEPVQPVSIPPTPPKDAGSAPADDAPGGGPPLIDLPQVD